MSLHSAHCISSAGSPPLLFLDFLDVFCVVPQTLAGHLPVKSSLNVTLGVRLGKTQTESTICSREVYSVARFMEYLCKSGLHYEFKKPGARFILFFQRVEITK